MADSARRQMTVEEFLVWDDGTDMRYELVDGQPVAMAPPTPSHTGLTGELSGRIHRQLANRPGCALHIGLGIQSVRRPSSYYVPDLLVMCGPADRKRSDVGEPRLVVEVLSPSTESTDRRVKLPDYRLIRSVNEVLLIDPLLPYAEIHRRLDTDRWLTFLLHRADARLVLESVGLDVALGDLYRDIPTPDGSASSA